MPKVSRAPKFRRGAGVASLGERQPKEKATREDLEAFGSTTSETRAAAGQVESAGSGRHDGESGSKQTSSASATLLSKSNQTALPSAEPSSKKLADPSRGKAASSKDDADGLDVSLHGLLSRGQRKRQAKKDQYLRKEQLVMASLKLRRDDEQRKRIDGLDAIRNALLESAGVVSEAGEGSGNSGDNPAASSAPSMLKTNHSKQKLVQREAAQMSLVLQHPAFQEDPFDAIRQHLRNTAATRTTATAANNFKNKKSQAEKEAKEKRVRHRKHRVKATRSKSRR